jgi:glycosyltransferase involved in cell wall biosynthesis
LREGRSVLVVAYDFPPHAAIGTMRTLRLVRHLDRIGWKVRVLTGDPGTYLPSTPVDQALLARVPSAVKVIRAAAWRRSQPAPAVTASNAGTAAPAATGAGRRHRWPQVVVRAKAYVEAVSAIPDRESAWWLPAVRAGLRAERQAPSDIIFSSAPPWTGQLVAYALASRLDRPWVADFRDPWARLPWRENRPWPVRRAAHLFEDMAVRKAAGVVFTTQAILDNVAAHHDRALAAKYHVVPNGCEVGEFAGLDARPTEGRFVLLHAGSLYGGRDPRPLMRAIAAGIRSRVIDASRFRLRLIGTQALEGVDLAAASEVLGLRDVVEIVPRMPRRDSLAEMMAASALLLVQPGHPLSIPAKAYEYLATGRPILAIADEGETANLVARSGAGIVVRGGDEEAMVKALGQLVTGTAGLRPAEPGWFDGERRAIETVDVFEAVLDLDRRNAAAGPQPVEVARRA